MSMTTVIRSSMTLNSPVQILATGVVYYNPLVLVYIVVGDQEGLIPVLILFIVNYSLLVLTVEGQDQPVTIQLPHIGIMYYSPLVHKYMIEWEQEGIVLLVVWWYSHLVLVYMRGQEKLTCWITLTLRSYPSQIVHHLVINVLMIIVSLI